ncbi:MAG: aminotransferase class V-fold PLP-dependent enzyme [Thermoanaerobaculia bacterium]|nr:aminotransferase class V-fold PLP-dependent enzyme [Thermoanaerobaculia bacterium]
MRSLFPITNHLVYFNHAALGPLSTRAFDAMQSHAKDQRDFGALHWRAWYEEYDKLRASAAKLIGSTPKEIAILKNTSEAISFVAQGLRWREGDNVITTDIEFPSNFVPWTRLKKRGVETRIVKSTNGAYEPHDIETLIDARTRLVSVTSVAFHNGFAPDLVAIGEICARRNVLFCVDAIQSLGMLPMDVRRAKISFLGADGHKWMCGPEGATIFYVAAEHLEELEVLEDGWTNIERRGKFIGSPDELLPDSRRFEAGTLNTNGIYGLRAAIDLLLEVGIDDIGREVVRLANHLAERLEGLGYRIASPRPLRSGIVAATPPTVESNTLLRIHRILEENGVVCSPREGMLRFAPHFYNDERDIARVIEVLSKV